LIVVRSARLWIDGLIGLLLALLSALLVVLLVVLLAACECGVSGCGEKKPRQPEAFLRTSYASP